MCDLVAQECDRMDSRFLEPTCGDGNFLAEIVKRKLNRCKQLYKRNAYDIERYSVLPMSSIYGVDLLQDDINESVNRLYKLWDKEYTSVCKKSCNDETRQAVKYIFSQNILCGNALTMMTVDEKQQDTEIPIIFPEWAMLMGVKFKRRDFRFDVLLKANTTEEKNLNLFNR